MKKRSGQICRKSAFLMILCLAILLPQGASAWTVAIYVDGFRVGEIETWDPHWWTGWLWGNAPFGGSGTAPQGGKIFVALADGTITDATNSGLVAGDETPDVLLEKLLSHPLNIESYSHPIWRGESPAPGRPDPSDLVVLEFSGDTLDRVIAGDSIDLTGLVEAVRQPDFIGLSVEVHAAQPCPPHCVYNCPPGAPLSECSKTVLICSPAVPHYCPCLETNA